MRRREFIAGLDCGSVIAAQAVSWLCAALLVVCFQTMPVAAADEALQLSKIEVVIQLLTRTVAEARKDLTDAAVKLADNNEKRKALRDAIEAARKQRDAIDQANSDRIKRALTPKLEEAARRSHELERKVKQLTVELQRKIQGLVNEILAVEEKIADLISTFERAAEYCKEAHGVREAVCKELLKRLYAAIDELETLITRIFANIQRMVRDYERAVEELYADEAKSATDQQGSGGKKLETAKQRAMPRVVNCPPNCPDSATGKPKPVVKIDKPIAASGGSGGGGGSGSSRLLSPGLLDAGTGLSGGNTTVRGSPAGGGVSGNPGRAPAGIR